MLSPRDRQGPEQGVLTADQLGHVTIIGYFWLRQEPKESLSVSVRLSVRYKFLSIHLSRLNLQAISQQSVRALREHSEH